jgi:UDP-2,3-diacylglucosamine hydrolase
MTTLFIADLHLTDDQPVTTQLFIDFLHSQARDAEALYILGDLFEVWIGDDYQTDLAQDVSKAMQTLAQSGVAIYFIHGNRDFLIGKQFAATAGITLLPDSSIINLYGVKTLLMHGDTLCTRDIAYLKFRKWVRNRYLQLLFLHQPIAIRTRIARQLRHRSSTHTQNASTEIMDVTPTEVPYILHKYQADLLIHGHTHRPSIEYLAINNRFASRIVLSDWHNGGNVLVCEPDGKKRLMNFGIANNK